MTHDISGQSRPPAFSAWRNPFSPSRRSMFTAATFVAAAAAVGAFGWSGEVLLLPLACLFPALWAFAPGRVTAGLVSMAYFMAASRGLPAGVSIFYASDIRVGLALWIAASLPFVTVHTVLWSPKPGWHRPLRYLLAVTLMSVPPLGIVGWASPITASGVLFPGWGWAGLAATVAVLFAMTTRAWPLAGVAISVALALSSITWTDPGPPEGWVGIDTAFDYQVAGNHADYTQHMTTVALVRRAVENGAGTVVLPESALGIWTPTTESLWTRNLADLDVVVAGGAVVVNESGYDSVMVELTGEGARILYRQRMPVPVSMWRPWASGGASAHLFGNPSGRLAGAVTNSSSSGRSCNPCSLVRRPSWRQAMAGGPATPTSFRSRKPAPGHGRRCSVCRSSSPSTPDGTCENPEAGMEKQSWRLCAVQRPLHRAVPAHLTRAPCFAPALLRWPCFGMSKGRVAVARRICCLNDTVTVFLLGVVSVPGLLRRLPMVSFRLFAGLARVWPGSGGGVAGRTGGPRRVCLRCCGRSVARFSDELRPAGGPACRAHVPGPCAGPRFRAQVPGLPVRAARSGLARLPIHSIATLTGGGG